LLYELVLDLGNGRDIIIRYKVDINSPCLRSKDCTYSRENVTPNRKVRGKKYSSTDFSSVKLLMDYPAHERASSNDTRISTRVNRSHPFCVIQHRATCPTWLLTAPLLSLRICRTWPSSHINCKIYYDLGFRGAAKIYFFNLFFSLDFKFIIC